MKYQVTILNSANKYRPVSAIVETDKVNLFNTEQKNKIINMGIKKICIARLWKTKDLKKFGYDKALVRVYDKEKIEQRKKERYEQLKEEKYQSGEWKRPKKVVDN
jgi:hypothetical protein